MHELEVHQLTGNFQWTTSWLRLLDNLTQLMKHFSVWTTNDKRNIVLKNSLSYSLVINLKLNETEEGGETNLS